MLTDASARIRLEHAGKRVLVAEDNPVNRLIAEELIRSAGLVVDCAIDGREAVDMARDGAYALIVMDIQMPELNGLDATRAIRARDGPLIPIIAMSADDSFNDRAACIEAGMNDHVSKPFDPPQLFTVLLHWLMPAESR